MKYFLSIIILLTVVFSVFLFLFISSGQKENKDSATDVLCNYGFTEIKLGKNINNLECDNKYKYATRFRATAEDGYWDNGIVCGNSEETKVFINEIYHELMRNRIYSN